MLLIVGAVRYGEEACCAPKYVDTMPNDEATVLSWVIGDVPVSGGVAMEGWKVKAVMEDQMGVPVIDLPGCGMVRHNQTMINMFATTRGITDKLRGVIEKGLQPMRLENEGDAVVWESVTRVWERVDRDKRFLK